MTWKGKWKNQYGSTLEITDDRDGLVTGVFQTALTDSGFYGQAIPISGRCQGDCIGVTGCGFTAAGDSLVTYTGLYRDGKLETLWLVVADARRSGGEQGTTELTKNNWWRAINTNSDTFERVA